MQLFGSKKQTVEKKDFTQKSTKTEFAPVDIYTLPEQFLPTRGTPKGGRKVSILTIVLVGVLVLLIAGGAFAWWYFSQQQETPIQQPTDNPALDITPLDEESDAPVTTTDQDNDTQQLPPALTHVAKDTSGNVHGTLVLQLSRADSALIEDITIRSQEVSSERNFAATYGFQITPQGRRLGGVATITIEYDDTDLTSVTENSLRIAYARGDGSWQFDERSVVAVQENTVTIELDQLPGSLFAVVSNLTTPSLPQQNDPDTTSEVRYEIETLTSSLDTDSDGLSDVEEILYETAFNRPDSDEDGYTDGSEVLNLYSPRDQGATLLASGQFTSYTNTNFDYTIFYPASWSVNEVEQNGSIVMFTSATNQFIEVIVEQVGPDVLNVMQWYQSQAPGITDEQINQLAAGTDSLPAIRSLDGTVMYYLIGEYVYGIGYNKGIEPEADYLTTWQAMMRSFSIEADSGVVSIE